jgi:putative membrane protein
MIDLALALFAGIFAGVITGLLPGIHNNLVSTLLISLSPTFTFLSPFAVALFIVSLAMTHIVVEFIPSIFLNIPEEDSFLALLPSQQLLSEGKGYEALVLLVLGFLLGLFLVILIAPLYLVFLPSLYPLLATTIPYFLIALSIYIICREQRPHLAAFVFLLSALLGLLAFHLPIREPLLPLLTGLFGISSMLTAQKTLVPKQIAPQKIRTLLPQKREFAQALAASLLAAPLCSSLPGIGSGHAATLGSEIIPQNNRSFLLLVGSLSATVMLLSFVVVFTIARARSGAAAAIQEVLTPFTHQQLATLLLAASLAAFLAAFITLMLGKRAAKILNMVNYRALSMGVIVFVALLTLLLSSWLGLLVLIAGISIGIVCIKTGVRRINLMASLIVPAILFYLMR